MTPEQVFSIANSVAMAGWLILILGLRTRWAATLVSGAIVPLLLAILYAVLAAAHWGETNGGFGSLAAVAALFSNSWLLLAGWVHFLAFDLFIGSWQVRDARAHGIPIWTAVPCLVLTFLFGPAGLLTYFGVRFVRMRTVKVVA